MVFTEPPSKEDLARVRWRGHASIFATTAGAVLFLLLLIGPISVNQFRSSVTIELRAAPEASDQQLATELMSVVHQETTPERIADWLDQVAVTQRFRAPEMRDRDLAAISQRLRVRIERSRERQAVRLRIGYDGQGYRDQEWLIRDLSQRIAGELQQLSSLAQVSARQMQAREQLDQVLARASTTNDSVEQLPAVGQSGRSAFQLTSSRKPGAVTTGNLGAADLAAELRLIRDALDPSAPTQPGLDVQQVGSLNTLALGARPGRIGWWLVLGISLLAGLITTRFANPLVNRGFTNLESISNQLGLPVAARIPATLRTGPNGAVSLAGGEQTVGWANRIADTCGLFLFGVSVIVIGFLIIDESIRQTFFNDPLSGLARIIGIFVGF